VAHPPDPDFSPGPIEISLDFLNYFSGLPMIRSKFLPPLVPGCLPGLSATPDDPPFVLTPRFFLALFPGYPPLPLQRPPYLFTHAVAFLAAPFLLGSGPGSRLWRRARDTGRLPLYFFWNTRRGLPLFVPQNVTLSTFYLSPPKFDAFLPSARRLGYYCPLRQFNQDQVIF